MALCIGVMSGTSADGVDISLLEVKKKDRFQFLSYSFYPYSSEMKSKILSLSTIDDLVYMHFALGECFASWIKRFMKEKKICKGDIYLISSHGQTVAHLPQKKRIAGFYVRGTLQIGDISVIAIRTGIPTAGDFRPAHIAGGGEGAPLSPFFHRAFFKDKKEKRAVLNIGGIANITFLDSNPVLAFDTGPGNMVVDALAKKFFKREMDRDGKIASKGIPNEGIIRKVLSSPFFIRRPPKSTGREEFGAEFLESFINLSGKFSLSPEDMISTASEITVRSILNAIKSYSPYKLERLIVCGGGAKNLYFMERLKEELKNVSLSDDFGIPSKAVESAGFALMGYCLMKGIPNDPEGRLILGKIAYPGEIGKK